jgi:hypothetical protein
MHFMNGHEHLTLPVGQAGSRSAVIIPQKLKELSTV